ncbi:hypothetical protein JCM6882_002918 [Rhodosporidiobolus microsporus]
MPRAGTAASASPPPAKAASLAPEDDLYEPGGKRAKQACETCRKRKLKCSRDVPACEFCVQHSHDCQYFKIVRTPLTRKNLDAAEKQINALHELLARQGYSESDIQRFVEGGSLPPLQPTPTPQPASFPPPPINPTPASMPPPPDALPAPPVFPPTAMSQSPAFAPPAAIHPAPHMTPNSQVSPLAAVSSSPLQQFAPVASTSTTTAMHLGLSVPTSASLDSFTGASPFSRPALVSMPSSFPAMAGPSVSHAPEAHMVPAPLPDHLTPAESAEGDGMGALTVGEGGPPNGYLGSLSGAALLHFLQRSAPEVNLSVKDSGKSAASPSSTVGSTSALSPEQLERYVSAYFRVFHLQYPIVHEASFRAQLAEIVPRPGGKGWNLLHAVVLGIGSMCVTGESEATEALALYERATLGVNAAMFETASLTAVQAFVLLGNYAQKLNHPSAGSIFLGIALRMAINLGMHCEASGKTLSPFEQEMRRRVWWGLYCFDSGAQLTFGHPSTLPVAGVDVLPMLNVQDSHFTPASLVRPPPCDTATAYSSMIYQCFFHAVAAQIISFITSRPSISAQDALRLQGDLQQLQNALPPYFFAAQPPWFDFARHKLAWRLDNLRMVIGRQIFLRVSLAQTPASREEEEAWEKCVACASEVIRSVSKFTEMGMRSVTEWWYALHFLFPAVFIPLIALRVRPSSPRALDWVVSIQSAKVVLERVPSALLRPLASRGLQIISAVANLEAKDPNYAPTAQIDVDFDSFLQMLAGPSDLDGSTAAATAALPAPGLLADLDQLFSWFTPAGSPQPMPPV